MTAAEALAWALVHFLWQGAALAALCWLALRLLRSAEARYVSACAVLCLMAAAPAVTMLALLDPAPAASSIAAPMPGWRGTLPGELDISWTALLMTWLPAAWATGAALLLARSAIAWWLARERTLAQLRPAATTLRHTVDDLGRRMHVGRLVEVFESATASTPQVFGWLRPILLIPAAIAGLTPQQLEAVIAHELAHIRRHDYLVNLLQTVVESLLYYHPAVWWVSSRIRTERELCCDEAAVQVCGDRVLYSRALLQLEETRFDFAMAAGASLKDRVGRILGMKERNNLMAPALALSAALIVGGSLVWAQQKPAPPAPPAVPAPAAMPDTVVVDGKTYKRKLAVAPPAQPVAPHAPKAPAPPAAPATPADEIRALDQQMRTLERQLQQLAERRQQLQRQAGVAGDQARQLEQEKQRLQKTMREMERQAAAEDQRAQRAEAYAKLQQLQASQNLEKETQRRIRYADERFAEEGRRGSETDRGKVYLKYGPPDEIETHPSEGKDAWLYRSGPIIRFEKGKLVSIDAAI